MDGVSLQPFAGERDLDLPAILDGFNLDASNIVDARGDLFGEGKAIGKIFEIFGRRHHDGERRAAYDDLNGRLYRDRSG